MYQRFTAIYFKQFINTIFKISIEGELPLPLELIEVKEKNQELIEAFSLIFRGPLDRVAHDNTYPIEHETLGKFDLFVGPFFTPTKKDATYYQAIFSRLKEE